MQFSSQGHTLIIKNIAEISGATSGRFKDEARRAFQDGLKSMDVDLSDTVFLDSSGLGALISLNKSTAERGGAVRLLNPPPPVRQILDLTRMQRIFEITSSGSQK